MSKIRFKFLTIMLILIAPIIFIIGNTQQNKEADKIKALASDYNKKIEAREEKFNLLESKIYSQIPGIVVYGDSLTAGAGGNGANYPNVIKKLIKKHYYDIPVINLGVGGEDVKTISGRAGSIPFIVKSVGESNKNGIEISLESENGQSVAPLRQGDGGINPVQIGNSSGRLNIIQSSPTDVDFKYYFQPDSKKSKVTITESDSIILNNYEKYENFMPIVFMGQNKGYGTNEQLIEYIKKILDMPKSNKKFLVLGLTSGTAYDRKDLESEMSEQFGNQYINLREYLVESGLEKANLKPTTKDLQAIENGEVPPSLLSDNVHFNSKGYEVIGEAVYERMVELEYFTEIQKYIEEISKL